MTRARAAETEAKGRRSLAMARTGSTMAQSGLGIGRQRHKDCCSAGLVTTAVGAPGGGNEGSCWLGRARPLEAGLSEGWGGEEMR